MGSFRIIGAWAGRQSGGMVNWVRFVLWGRGRPVANARAGIGFVSHVLVRSSLFIVRSWWMVVCRLGNRPCWVWDLSLVYLLFDGPCSVGRVLYQAVGCMSNIFLNYPQISRIFADFLSRHGGSAAADLRFAPPLESIKMRTRYVVCLAASAKKEPCHEAGPFDLQSSLFGYAGVTLVAQGPFFPSPTSNWTFWSSSSVA